MPDFFRWVSVPNTIVKELADRPRAGETIHLSRTQISLLSLHRLPLYNRVIRKVKSVHLGANTPSLTIRQLEISYLG